MPGRDYATRIVQDEARGQRKIRCAHQSGRRLPVCEDVTRLHDAARIDRDVTFIDVPDDALFVDHEGGAISKTLLLIEDTIILDYGAFEVAEDRKRDFDLFCKFAVGGNTVYTHAEYLSVG